MEAYVYEPLQTDEFRLLEIHHSAPGSDSIHCRIIHTCFGKNPQYNALSYAWGDPSRVQSISIETRPLGVTSNLFEALKHLKSCSSEFSSSPKDPSTNEDQTQSSIYLWVDAVCIDQNNFRERKSQVQIMGLIYEEAMRVVVWLGPEPGPNDEAFEVVRKLAGLNSKPDELRRYNPSELTLSQVKDFQKFARNPWFSRMWVIQEVVMSSHETLFLRGSQSLTFKELHGAISVLCKPMYPSGVAEARARNVPGATEAMRAYSDHIYTWSKLVKVLSTNYVSRWVDQMKILGVLTARRRRRGAGMYLEYLLCHLSERDATDHRDMVYALLGMCNHPGAFEKQQKYEHSGFDVSKLVVDYEASLLDVYSSVVEAVAFRTSNLDIIYAIHPEESNEWPSWVPVWSRKSSPESPRDTGLLTKGSFFCIDQPIEVTTNCNNGLYAASKYFSASPNNPKISFIIAENVLSVKGIIWDTIKTVWPSRTHTAQYTGVTSRAFYLDHIRANQNDYGVYGSAKQAEEAVWRTLVTNKEDEWQFDEAPTHWGGLYKQWVNDESPRKGRDHFQLAMGQHLYRNFIISSKGYFGLAPRRTLSEDIICVILGCSVPIVLRKVERGYRLIGDIYVHGIMKGEVMDELEKGGVELEEIHLV